MLLFKSLRWLIHITCISIHRTFVSRLLMPHCSEVPRPQGSISTLPCMWFKLLVSKLVLLINSGSNVMQLTPHLVGGAFTCNVQWNTVDCEQNIIVTYTELKNILKRANNSYGISIGYTTRWRSLRGIHYRVPQARGCVYRRDRNRVV